MDRINQIILKYEPVFHVLFWCAALFYPRLKFLVVEGDYPNSFWHDLVEITFYMIPGYVLYLWFYPLKNKRTVIYLVPIIFLVNMALYMYVDSLFHSYNPYPINLLLIRTIITIIIGFLSYTLVFFALFSIKQLYKKQKEIEEIAIREQQAQLRLLKGQINPHFLFNTLNTIYSSSLDGDPKTPDLILKLSDNFRYVLHEGQKNVVTLQKEIRHIKGYINLQKERLADKVNVTWRENIDDYEMLIPPLLLISFVENAFKYTSMLSGKDNKITIKIVLVDTTFIFYCENLYLQNMDNEVDEDWKKSGIGIHNTIERLKLLFPKRHKLNIVDKGNKFIVDLEITL